MFQVRVMGVLLGVVLFLSQTVCAVDAVRVQEIFLKNGLDPQELGIIIEDDGGKLFALNETKKLKPASLTKILTAGAALEYLGPNFRIQNQDAE